MTRTAIAAGGRRRTYLHVPPARVDPIAPLLLALHGSTQTGATMRRFSGRTLDDLAARIGADLVYLDGYHRAWNDARRLATSAAQKKDVDDVAFVRAVIDRFERPAIAIGYSNGGQLVHKLLHGALGLLSGAVIVAAGLPVDDDFTLRDGTPDRVPTLLLHGTADPVVPYEGGPVRLLGRPKGTVRSARATADAYAPATDASVARSGDIERTDWGSVRLVTQFGVGHVIPNRKSSPRFVGPSHHDLDLGEEAGSFFGL